MVLKLKKRNPIAKPKNIIIFVASKQAEVSSCGRKCQPDFPFNKIHPY